MGNDDAAIAANGFVRSSLLRMPMRVDQRVYAVVSGSFLYSFQQSIRIGGKPAIDHQTAIVTMHGNDITAGALEEKKPAEIGGRNLWTSLRRRGCVGPGKRPAECGSAGGLNAGP